MEHTVKKYSYCPLPDPRNCYSELHLWFPENKQNLVIWITREVTIPDKNEHCDKRGILTLSSEQQYAM